MRGRGRERGKEGSTERKYEYTHSCTHGGGKREREGDTGRRRSSIREGK